MADPITLSPEQQAEYEQKAAQAAPQPINPLKDFDAATLADLSAKDPTFNVVDAFRQNKDLWADPATVQKVADAHNLVRQRGFKVEDIAAVRAAKEGHPVDAALAAAKPVWDIAKGFGKQAWNYATAAVMPLVGAAGELTGQGPGFVEETNKVAQRAVAENFAGTEQAVTGLAEMLPKAAGKVGRALGLAKPLEAYTPEEKAADLWSAVGTGETQEDIAKGHGAFMTGVGGEVVKGLEEAGKPVRPEETAVTAAGDPFSWWAFGKAFQGAGKLVPSAAGEVAGKVAAATGEKLASAAGKGVELAGTLKHVGGSIASGAGKTAAFVAPLAGAVEAVHTGSLIPLATGGIVRGMAQSLTKLGQHIAKGTGLANRLGAEIAGKADVTLPISQAIRDTALAAPGAAGEIAKGAAFDLGLGAATSETPQDTEGLGIGAAFGALGAARHVGGRVLSGQLIAPRNYEVRTPVASSGQFPALDAMHRAAFDAAEPAVKARLNAVRQFVTGAAPGTDVFMGDTASIAEALKKQGISDAQADHFAAQSGFFTTSLPGADGKPRRIAIVKDVAAAPHEAFHAVQDVLGEPANRQVDAIVREAYAPEWDAQGTRYAQRLAGGELPGTWQETVNNLSGWGADAAKEKILTTLANRMPGAFPEQVQEAARAELGRLTDEALQRNNHLTPEEAQANVWRDVLTPEEAQAVADRYLARELAAENFDLVFKHTGPTVQTPKGLLPKLADVVGQVVTAFGGNPLAGRTSEIGGIAPKMEVTRAVQDVAKGQLANAPVVAPRQSGGAARPVVPVPGTPEGRTAVVDRTRSIAQDVAAEPALPGTSQTPTEKLGHIADAISRGESVYGEYYHAPGETPSEQSSQTVVSDPKIREAVIEASRNMDDSSRQLFGSAFFPYDIRQTAKGPFMQTYVPGVIAANTVRLVESATKAGVHIPYEVDPNTATLTPDAWRQLYDDLKVAMANHEAGRTASGEPLVVPKMPGVYEPALQPAEGSLPVEKMDFINAAFGIEKPTSAKLVQGKIPGNVIGQRISEATMPGRISEIAGAPDYSTNPKAAALGLAGEKVQEVNPLLAQLRAAGADPKLFSASQKLFLNHLAKVERAPEAVQLPANINTLRAGFQPQDWRITGKRRGVNDETIIKAETEAEARTKAAAQGFRVDKATRTATPVPLAIGSFQPNKEPDAIARPAVRAASGKIYEGIEGHWQGSRKAYDAGENTEKLVMGFVDNSGKFYDRKQAFRQAVRMGQITGEEFHPRPGELETTTFQHHTGQSDWMPDFSGQAQPNAIAAEVEKMSSDEFMKWTQNLPTGFTRVAHDLGRAAKTQGEVDHLRAAQAAMQTKFKTALEAGDMDNAMTLASQGQFFREAAEAAEGTGSAGSFLKKDPNYKPPFPPGERIAGQAAPARNEDVAKVADEYAKEAGRTLRPSVYAPLDEAAAKKVADHFEELSHDPANPEVKSAYDALAAETEAQYRAIEAAGYTMEPFTGKGEPYKSSADMVSDVTKNKHLFYLPTQEAFDATSDNLMLRPSGIEGRPVNDIFRAVHDFFGHAKEGLQFGPRGEFNAWREHSQMYSEDAQPALAAETLAQNAWVNFGAHMRNAEGRVPTKDEQGYVAPAARRFAEQKNVVISPEVIKSMQAQPASREPIKTEDLDQYKGRSHSFWISPKGEIINAGGDHRNFVVTNPDLFSIPADSIDTTFRGDTVEAAQKKGWVRVVTSGGRAYPILAEGNVTRPVKRALEDLHFATGEPGVMQDTGMSVRELIRRKETSGQAQPKRKDEFKLLSGGPEGTSKAWITPSGKVEQLGGMWHHHWLAEDPAGVAAAKKAGLDIPPFEGNDTDGVRESAIRKGFVRVAYENRSGALTIEGRAVDWPKQKAAVEKLVENNLGKLDKLRVNLLDETASHAVDSRAVKLFELDTDAEKMAAIPFLNEAPRAARAKVTDNPAYAAPDELGTAPLRPVYGKPDFHGFDKTGKYIGKFGKYQDALDAAGPGGTAKMVRTIEGQAQPASEEGIRFSDKTFDDKLKEVRAGSLGGVTFNPDGTEWKPDPKNPSDIVTLASVNVAPGDLNRDNVMSALGPYSDLLDEPGVVAGVFSFSQNGKPKVSIDVNAVVPQKYRRNSLDFGKQNDQVSIWDSAKEEEVRTGGKGFTKLQSVGEITDALTDLVRGKPVDVAEIMRQNRESEPALRPGELFDESKPVLSSVEQSNMTKADLAAHFPESVIPRRRDEPISSDIKSSPLFKAAGSEAQAVQSFARKLVEFANEWADDPRFQSGLKWYSEFVPMLKAKFGADAPIFAELLAATSPQNAPESNFAYAVDALEGLKSGRFSKLISKYEEGLNKLNDGTWERWAKRELGPGVESPTPAAFLGEWIDKYDLLPRQSNGQKYGISSTAVLQVLARRWLQNTGGPKTQNFVQNLLGTGHDATIDLWADRTMRRVGYSGHADRWRILPKNATGVSDADFHFSQKAFDAAAAELGVKPDALQGGLWFAEKAHWNNQGWTRLDLGDYRKEIPKTDALRAGVRERLRKTVARAKVKPTEAGDLFDLVQPRKLK